MFPGFDHVDVDADGVRIHAAVGGSGPPLLLLHGYPQTHAMWHKIAPRLAEEFRVVAADLRGYGDSQRPPAGEDHAGYGKRAMAADQVAVMRALGHERFAVAGHDRGARVAHRMCRDHPDRVSAAALLDIVPTRVVYETTDRATATAYFHWFLLIQDPPLPERMIDADREAWLRSALARWGADPDAFTDAAVAEYLRCFSDPDTVHATTEDYRAGASIDLEHDAADGDARVGCPLLVLWGGRGFVGKRYEVLDVWRDYATDVRGHDLPCGHFLPEEDPDGSYRALREFFTDVAE